MSNRPLQDTRPPDEYPEEMNREDMCEPVCYPPALRNLPRSLNHGKISEIKICTNLRGHIRNGKLLASSVLCKLWLVPAFRVDTRLLKRLLTLLPDKPGITLMGNRLAANDAVRLLFIRVSLETLQGVLHVVY
jgi:hypothetical protein